jgi:hypothetical protein
MGYDIACYRSSPKKTLDECQKICDDDKKCLQFDFQKNAFCCPGYVTRPLTNSNGVTSYEKKPRSIDKSLDLKKVSADSKCQFSSYKKTVGQGIYLCDNELGEKAGTVAECQSHCNEAQGCYGFNHTDGTCQFVGSSNFMTGPTPGSDLYVKECIEFEDISQMFEDMKKNPDQQKLAENLLLLKMVFNQLDQHPESFYLKKADEDRGPNLGM